MFYFFLCFCLKKKKTKLFSREGEYLSIAVDFLEHLFYQMVLDTSKHLQKQPDRTNLVRELLVDALASIKVLGNLCRITWLKFIVQFESS